jgi:hypothetical protein
MASQYATLLTENNNSNIRVVANQFSIQTWGTKPAAGSSLATVLASSSNVTVLTVSGSNIGIGTTLPRSTLDVQGDLSITGNLTKGGLPLAYDWIKTGSTINVAKGTPVGVGTTNTQGYDAFVNGNLGVSSNIVTSNITVLGQYFIANDTGAIRNALQLSPVKANFVISTSQQSSFFITQEGVYTSSASNTDVYINGLKLAHNSSTLKDFDVSLFWTTSSQTVYTVTLTKPAIYGDVVDISIWPSFINTTATKLPGYVYQQFFDPTIWQYVDASNVYRPNGNVGIGTSQPVLKLDVQGKVASFGHVHEAPGSETDVLQGSPALGRFVAMESYGTVYYALPYAGSILYELDPKIGTETIKVSKTTTATSGSIAVTAGYEYYTNGKPVDFNADGFNHTMVPLATVGRYFGAWNNRAYPHTFYVYSPFSTVIIKYYCSTGVQGTPVQTITVPMQTVTTITSQSVTGSETHIFEVVGGVAVMSVKGSQVNTTHINGNLGGDMGILYPATSIQYVYSVITAAYDIYQNTVSTAGNKCVFSSNNNPTFATYIGDGYGDNYTPSVPLEVLSDTYAMGHNIRDYEFVIPYPNTSINVSYSSNSSWYLYKTHEYPSSCNITITSPFADFQGTPSGANTASYLATGASQWLFSGNNPFLLRTNDYSGDEYCPRGWRAQHYSALTKDGYSFSNIYESALSGNIGIGTSDPSYKLHVIGDVNFTGNLYQNGSMFVSGGGGGGGGSSSQWTTTPNASIFINSNVGIGTDDPTTSLHVYGTSTFTDTMTLPKNATISPFEGDGVWIGLPKTGPSALGSGSPGSDAWIGYAYVNGNWFGDALAGDICYRNFGGRLLYGFAAEAHSICFSLSSSYFLNNVGIGTNNPQNKLDVYGSCAIGTYAGIDISGTNGLIVSGNVGIGTTSPTQALDVRGPIRALANGQWLQATDAANQVFTGFTKNGNRTQIDSPMGNFQFTNNISIKTTNGVNTNSLDVNGAVAVGSSYAGVRSAPSDGALVQGSVGIGTTACVNKLDVNGSLAVGASYAGIRTAPTDGLLIQGSVGIGTTACVNKFDVNGSMAIGASYAGTRTAPTDGLLVQGNVGIGTTSPSVPLVVLGTTNNTGTFKVCSSTSGTGDQWWMGFGHSSASTDANDRARIGVNISSANAGRLYFTTGTAGNQTERVRIDENGNVGIGTGPLTPSFKLDVNGSARVTSNVTLATTMQVHSFTRLLGATANDFTNICELTAANGAYTIFLNVVHSESGSSESRTYIAAIDFISSALYYVLNPISSTGAFQGTQDWMVEINTNGNTSTLRLVRISGTSTNNFTCTLSVFQSSANQVSVNPSTTTGSGATNSGVYATTQIAQIDGNVGIGVTNPSYKLDVSGSSRIQSAYVGRLYDNDIYAGFMHSSLSPTNNEYALLAFNTGETAINYKSGTKFSVRRDNAEVMVINNSGQTRFTNISHATITKNLPAGNTGAYVDVCEITNGYNSFVEVTMTFANDINLQIGTKQYFIPITTYCMPNAQPANTPLSYRVLPLVSTPVVYGPFDCDLEVRLDEVSKIASLKLVKKMFSYTETTRNFNVTCYIKIFSLDANVAIVESTTSGTGYTISTNIHSSTTLTQVNSMVGILTDSPSSTLDVKGSLSVGTYSVAAPSNGLLVSGNVGIGTTNPTRPLHIVTPTNTLIQVTTDTSAVGQISGIEFGIPTSVRSKIFATTKTGDKCDLTFSVQNGAATPINTMYLSEDGNVGIGTLTTGRKLHLFNTGTNNYVRIQGDTAQQQGIEFFDTVQRWAIFKPGNSTNLAFYPGSGANRVVFSSNGATVMGDSVTGYGMHTRTLTSTATYTVNTDITDTNRNLSIVNPSTSTSANIYTSLSFHLAPSAGLGASGRTLVDMKVVRKTAATSEGALIWGGYNSAGTAYQDCMELNFNTGNLLVRGDITGFNTFSDQRLKTDIHTLDGALQKINMLRPVEYKWKDDIPVAHKRGQSDVGLIAQDVEPYFPLVITEHDLPGTTQPKYFGIKYEKLVPYLIRAVQELSTENQLLRDELKLIKQHIGMLS